MSSVATRENDRDAHHVPRKCFPGTIKTVEQHVVWYEFRNESCRQEEGVNELHDSLRRTGGN